ncbi:hypothetical protein H4CHR_04388 [Variovorax sp. PBS-H4]|uniref:hypothetical protein n=1 Tax=Variovorax sp. PBS-H4 TaxID=434008 RepID=UPI0013178DE3|nr:hypothetical protein [Variovorax sp. PBS-H4]VTU38297.1 hypothetical protein H4CHR_04388 [Variovorax sp. PBS-H4]
MAISEEDLRGLSAVERETLIAAEEDDEDGDIARELGQPAARDDAAPAKAAPEVPGDGDEDPEAEAAAAAAAAAAPAAAPAAPKEGDPPAAADPSDDETGLEAQPARVAPADLTEQRTALNQREDESMQKLLDGEITQEEHAKTKNEVRASLDNLLVLEATDRATMQLQRDGMMKDYNADLRDTVKSLKTSGLDLKGDEKLKTEFDRAVRLFAQEAEEDGLSDAPGNLAASKRALDEAKALMLRRHGKAAAAAPTPAPPAATTTKAPGPRPPADRSQIPPTLAGVPVAGDARITSEFAHLDGLEHADLELELAKMTPQQQERYLDA